MVCLWHERRTVQETVHRTLTSSEYYLGHGVMVGTSFHSVAPKVIHLIQRVEMCVHRLDPELESVGLGS